jgi:hypothetical protein
MTTGNRAHAALFAIVALCVVFVAAGMVVILNMERPVTQKPAATMTEGSRGATSIAVTGGDGKLAMGDTKATAAVAALAIITAEKIRTDEEAAAKAKARKAPPTTPRLETSGWSVPYGVHGAPSKAQAALTMTEDVGYPVALRPDYWNALALAVGCPQTFAWGGRLTDSDALAILRCAQSPVAR